MKSILDYTKAFGHLPLKDIHFNNIDALILARFSYIPLDGLDGAETIAQAARACLAAADTKSRLKSAKDYTLLSALAGSRRFGEMGLSRYVNQVDYQQQKQFSAITIDTGDGSRFVSYRGTDNTLVGWKEDFNMSFMATVPAQLEAAEYLKGIAGEGGGSIRVGGHSKGGNLAAYAAAFAGLQQRITAVYNFDGPGFDASLLQREGYSTIKDRIHTFVPQSSVIGMLLEHEEEYRIINSRQIGLWQHDLYSWEVVGSDFIYLRSTTNGSKHLDKVVKGWVAELEPEQREEFINVIYDVFKSTNARTLKELARKLPTNAPVIVRSFKDLDEPVKRSVLQTLKVLAGALWPSKAYTIPPDDSFKHRNT